jgi:hypothetical protein
MSSLVPTMYTDRGTQYALNGMQSSAVWTHAGWYTRLNDRTISGPWPTRDTAETYARDALRGAAEPVAPLQTEEYLRGQVERYDNALIKVTENRYKALRALADKITAEWLPGDIIRVYKNGKALPMRDQPFGAVTGDSERYVTVGEGYAQRSYPVGSYTFENLTQRDSRL